MDNKYITVEIYVLVIFFYATSVLCQLPANSTSTQRLTETSTTKHDDVNTFDEVAKLFSPNQSGRHEGTTTDIPNGSVKTEDDTKLTVTRNPIHLEGGSVVTPSGPEGTDQVNSNPHSAKDGDLSNNTSQQSTETETKQQNVTQKTQASVQDLENLKENDPPSTDRHQPSKGRKGVNLTEEVDAVPPNHIGINQSVVNKTCSNSTGKNCAETGNQDQTVNPSTINSTSALKENGTIASKVEDGTDLPSTIKPSLKVVIQTNNNTVTDEPYVKGDILSSPTLKKKKPMFTLDEASTTVPELQQVPSSISPESNYIIPIVATILAAPLLIVLLMFMYKRGTEFWERRHYRRMDFLIDGMYND